MNYFRRQPQPGKYILVATKPWQEYRIGVLSGQRGKVRQDSRRRDLRDRGGRPPRHLPAPRARSEGGRLMAEPALRPATIHGYADRLSVAPGETIEFKVSCDEPGSYRADVVRLVHGDTNPAGPGFKEEEIASAINGSYEGRHQPIRSGSHVIVDDPRGALALTGAFTLHAFVLPDHARQGRPVHSRPPRCRERSRLRADDRGRAPDTPYRQRQRRQPMCPCGRRAGTPWRAPTTPRPARRRSTRSRCATPTTACSRRWWRYPIARACSQAEASGPEDARAPFVIAGCASAASSTG